MPAPGFCLFPPPAPAPRPPCLPASASLFRLSPDHASRLSETAPTRLPCPLAAASKGGGSFAWMFTPPHLRALCRSIQAVPAVRRIIPMLRTSGHHLSAAAQKTYYTTFRFFLPTRLSLLLLAFFVYPKKNRPPALQVFHLRSVGHAPFRRVSGLRHPGHPSASPVDRKLYPKSRTGIASAPSSLYTCWVPGAIG